MTPEQIEASKTLGPNDEAAEDVVNLARIRHEAVHPATAVAGGRITGAEGTCEDLSFLLATVDAQAARIAELEAQLAAAKVEHGADLASQDVGRVVTREQSIEACAAAWWEAHRLQFGHPGDPAWGEVGGEGQAVALDLVHALLDDKDPSAPASWIDIIDIPFAVARALGLIPSTEKTP